MFVCQLTSHTWAARTGSGSARIRITYPYLVDAHARWQALNQVLLLLQTTLRARAQNKEVGAARVSKRGRSPQAYVAVKRVLRLTALLDWKLLRQAERQAPAGASLLMYSAQTGSGIGCARQVQAKSGSP